MRIAAFLVLITLVVASVCYAEYSHVATFLGHVLDSLNECKLGWDFQVQEKDNPMEKSKKAEQLVEHFKRAQNTMQMYSYDQNTVIKDAATTFVNGTEMIMNTYRALIERIAELGKLSPSGLMEMEFSLTKLDSQSRFGWREIANALSAVPKIVADIPKPAQATGNLTFKISDTDRGKLLQRINELLQGIGDEKESPLETILSGMRDTLNSRTLEELKEKRLL